MKRCGKNGSLSAEKGYFPLLIAAGISLIAAILAGCGGGRSSSPTPRPIPQNPVPSIASITPSSAPMGSGPLTLTVTGSGFFPGSIVRWNGLARATTYESNTRITAAIISGDLATARSVAVTVYNPAPGGGLSGALSFVVSGILELSILTTRLPDAAHDKMYSYTLRAGGGIPPYYWTVASGSLPSGLTLASGGAIYGMPPSDISDTNVEFSVQVSDHSVQPVTALKPLSILVRARSLERNDTCAAATPVLDGITRASISPYGDVDIFSFNGTAGDQVTIEIYSQRLTLYGDPASRDVFLDSFLELLNSSCEQITYNDDIILGLNQDSLIPSYTLPYTGTYYVRVSDLRSDGRPDFIYDLRLSGAD